MNIKEELLINQAKEGYIVCYVEQCPLHNQCLRWLVGQHLPHTDSTYRCVNPHFEGVATADCPMYRNDQKVCFAKGMMNIFTNDMPRRVESAVRQGIVGLTNRTYYFEYRNGSRLIPPALQQAIRDLFRTNGWTEEVKLRMDGRSEIRQLCRGLRLVDKTQFIADLLGSYISFSYLCT